MRNRIIPGCEPQYLKGGTDGCLMLHGFTSSPFEMRFLGEQLHREGFTVHIPLLPGHGTNPANLKSNKWYDWFETAKNELFLLRKKCKRVYVIGFSMGGSLALHLAAHYEINGVAALAPGLYLTNRFAVFSHGLKHIIRYSRKYEGSDIKAPVKTISYEKISVHAISELLKLFRHLKQDLRDIYAPLLIIYAREDHVIDGKSAKIIYKNVSSSNKRILELTNSYHIITLDYEKEKVYSEISAFLKSL